MKEAASTLTKDAPELSSEELALARLLVSALSLEIAAEDIKPDQALFRDGLGLDSIDALEIAMTVSKTYNVTLKSDDERNHKIFASIRSLSAYIEQHRIR